MVFSRSASLASDVTQSAYVAGKNRREQTTVTDNFALVEAIADKFDRDPSRLIAILQAAQAEFGYLPEPEMNHLAHVLGISPARIFGVATFYSHFTLNPKGKYLIRLCDGTACHVKKSSDIIAALHEELGLNETKTTTDDGLFTMELVACLGACGLAPVMVVNDKVHGQMTVDKALDLIREIKAVEEGGVE